MTVEFVRPSFRASNPDLTIAISPLGLVEMSDEEFEVHGPRLNRYAQNWAFYLGHHWSHRREAGEPQLTLNYVRALSDFITNFCFGRGVTFKTPLATSAIVPALLSRVWEVDNDKASLLWEIGNLGSVGGDVFIKVAYEDPHLEPTEPVPGIAQQMVPGRVRILPLNPSFVFPVWHPHDRTRMMSCKVKYKFWGTGPDGTRAVYTYTEVLTDTWIEEYVNDEQIDARPNPLGKIPVVHIPNVKVNGSPWGLSDISDVVPLNRVYNEVATDVIDMINYHAAPLTVISGAKASQLEKGAKRTWTLPRDATIQNIEMNPSGVTVAMGFLESLKKAMHEMTGVPEGALGQMQPISNTSGVALAIQYQPMMSRYSLKKTNFSQGFEDVNALVMKTLAMKEPESLTWQPYTLDAELKPDQLPVLDPEEPVTYQTETNWPAPLPTDVLVKLNEIQLKMGLGLESKRGALEDLGEEFPDEKMREIFRELIEDTNDQAALDMVRAQYQQMIMVQTGMVPDGNGGTTVPSAGGSAVNSTGGSSGGGGSKDQQAPGRPPNPEVQSLFNDLVTRAYGTKLAQFRNPDNPSAP